MIKVHNAISQARLAGSSWDDIDGFLGSKQQEAMAAGYFPTEITNHLGYSDPQRLRDRLEAEAMINYAMTDHG